MTPAYGNFLGNFTPYFIRFEVNTANIIDIELKKYRFEDQIDWNENLYRHNILYII